MNLANFETMDSVMLMSMVNMKLRDDFGGDLDRLARFYDIDVTALKTKLAEAGFEYLTEVGQFR